MKIFDMFKKPHVVAPAILGWMISMVLYATGILDDPMVKGAIGGIVLSWFVHGAAEMIESRKLSGKIGPEMTPADSARWEYLNEKLYS